MARLFTAVFLFFPLALYAQFAVIQDPDGYTFIRSGPGKNFTVTDTILQNELFYADDEGDNNWFFITRIKNGSTHSCGWMHNSRILRLDSMQAIPLEIHSATTLSFRNDSVHILIKTAPFNATGHKLKYEQEGTGSHYISQIDGQEIYGSDGRMPLTRYSSIEVQLGSSPVPVPPSAWKNLFEPNLYRYTQAVYDPGTKRLYLNALNGDAAGTYAVCWIFENGRYKERIILRP